MTNDWHVVDLPFAGNVASLKTEGKRIVATGVNGKKAISYDFGLSWQLYRERCKFRRYHKQGIK